MEKLHPLAKLNQQQAMLPPEMGQKKSLKIRRQPDRLRDLAMAHLILMNSGVILIIASIISLAAKKDLKTPQTIQAISRRIMRHSISPLIMAAVEIRKPHLTLISIIPFLAK